MAELHHVRRGSGPPLVLLHGIAMEWRAWEPVLDALAEHRDVTAVDLPGFGASPPLPAGVTPTVGALTGAVERFLARLGLGEPPHAGGNSLGGAIALELARRRAVASATAISPAGFWTDAERRWCQRSLRLAVNTTRALRPLWRPLSESSVARTLGLAQLFGRPWRIPPDAVRGIMRAGTETAAFEPTLAAFDAYRFGAGHELAAVPVTVAWGEHDWLLLPREGRRVPRLLPHARFLWLEGCGHVPTWDDPELVARVLLEGSARTAAPAGATR